MKNPENNKSKSHDNEKDESSFLTIGLSLGISIGAALGLVFDNLAIGIALGIALGIAVDSTSIDAASWKNKTK